MLLLPWKRLLDPLLLQLSLLLHHHHHHHHHHHLLLRASILQN
ncbi:hypothetical protein GLYMA_17G222633v4 [Glycine max]|nr:hypothetical protein GLYMA_17G222633v4 [Glycine max]KAH1119602.1 hypothetical protein GYH30_048119 [Glycine max]